MKMLTAQQIFNKSAKHLLTQKKKARHPSGGCMMMTDKGLRCATGCLVNVSLYKKSPGLATDAPGDPAFKEALLKSGVRYEAHNELLALLVHCHDDFKPSKWKSKLKSIAQEFKLKMVK